MKLWLVIVCLTSTSMGKPFDPPQPPPPSEPPLEILIPPPPGENKDLIKPVEPPMICRPCVNQCALCPRAEKTKDACGCCVCTRKQHETCGRRAGVCGKGLYCKQDFLLLFGTPGICEAEVCKEKICGFQELCELDTKSGGPKCSCERDCSKKPTAKVCSWESDEVFDNFCEVEQEECKLGKKIDTYPCTECTKGFGPSKKVYKNGEIIQTKKPCLKEICRNARFEKYLDGECLKENGYTCVDSSENFKDVKCNENQYCRYTFVDKDNEIPSLGQCLEKEKDKCYFEERVYKEGETYIDKGCTKSCICNHTMLGEKCKPLCVQAMVSCAPDETAVKYLEATSNTCFCEIKRCIKNAEICRYKKKTGPCYASIPMWYYDSSEKLCKSFVYGGCRGNSNKFYTKEACLDFCQPDVVTVKVSPNGEEKSPLSLVEGDSVVTLGLKDTDEYTRPPQLAELIEKNPVEARFSDATPAPRLMSEKNMTISGKILLGRNVEIAENSCLVVTLSDVTLLDISDRPLAEKVYQFNKIFETDDLQFEITSKKPVDKDIYRDYAIRAVLNRGYCGNNKTSWIKKNDYVTDTTHSLVLSADKDVYNKDIQTVCYDCKDEIRGPFGEIVGVEKKVIKKSNKSVTVSGTIKFPKKVPALNSLSCLLISIRDISLADASSELLVVKRLDDLSKINGASEYKYTVETRKPEKFLGRDFSVGAVLNINWCPDLDQNANLLNPKGEWIRDGDFVADTTFKIPFTEEESGYEKDFHLICYNCKDTSEVVPVIPPPANDEGCKDTAYKHGEEWISEKDPCEKCTCYNGVTKCSQIKCRRIENCDVPVTIVVGQCCLECPTINATKVPEVLDKKSCMHDGKEYKNGDKWKPEDCLDCSCLNGKVICGGPACEASKCENYEKVPGSCCDYTCPAVKVPDVIAADLVVGEVGEKTEGCLFEDRSYSEGDKRKNENEECVCNAEGQWKCQPVGSCFDKNSNKTYQNGEEWVTKDFCGRCVCFQGQQYCASALCDVPECPGGEVYNVEGRCCPVCSTQTICKDENTRHTHTDADVWQNERCHVCTCGDQGITCRQPDVNFDGCKVKVQLTKQCGLVCLQREDEEESREIEEDREEEEEEEVKENEAIEGDDEEEEVDGNGDDMEKEENEEGIEKYESDSIENEKKKETEESDGEEKEVEKKVLTCTESHGVYKVGESYKRDCNTCTCMGGVDGEMVWACTLMACLDESETFPKVVKEEKEKAGEQNGKKKNEEGEKNVEEKEKVVLPTCTKSDGVYKVGESYKRDCNTCTCMAGPDGTAGWTCTEMGCMS